MDTASAMLRAGSSSTLIATSPDDRSRSTTQTRLLPPWARTTPRLIPSAGSVIPKDLGEWQSTVEFALGPYSTGKELGDVSAFDLGRADSRDSAAICRQGYGALLAKLAEGIPVQLDTAVKLVDVVNRGSKVELTTTKGEVSGRFCIITASTNVVLDRIKFDGELSNGTIVNHRAEDW